MHDWPPELAGHPWGSHLPLLTRVNGYTEGEDSSAWDFETESLLAASC